jgi:hypothetical protein
MYLIDTERLSALEHSARNLFTLADSDIFENIATFRLSKALFLCSQSVAKPADSGKQQWMWWISRSH